MAKFNEKKYEAAIKTIAEQVLAMVAEDYTDDDDQEVWDCAAEDYAGSAVEQIMEKMNELK